MSILTPQAQQDLLRRGYSRRSFGKISALVAGGATLPFYNEAALAQLSMMRNVPADAVRINANENPLGPCPEAAEAMYSVIKGGGRYQYERTFEYAKVQADIDGVKPEYVLPFAGSSAPLHYSVIAFTSKERGLVTADPDYEAAGRAAAFVGAKVTKVKLDAANGYKHDVKAMLAADPNAGAFYVCNPNNPSGTLTPKSDIAWLIANKPAGSVVILDEAYIHLTKADFGSDFVQQDKDVVILRTFSKLYGMAGLRAGCAIGRPDLINKLRGYTSGANPVTGMVGATASLQVKDLVAKRSKIIGDIREDVLSWATGKGYSFIPSVSNKFMIDVKMPAQKYIQSMVKEKVLVGRAWPSMPTHVRVSIGTADEMAKWKAAHMKVMA
ncbi:MAG: pyridoxal phosphate-dependent aminotransferase [Bryobacter sp.]|nr:pyridoxal phosphate-dependent aminotransferase [Bryobacter sp.]